MRKCWIICLTMLSCYISTSAQKHFINAVEAKTFIYQDFYEIPMRKWKNFFADGYQTRAYDLDTMQFSGKGKAGAYPGFNSGWGVKLDLIKGFLPNANHDVNRLEWAVGLGYRKYTYKFDGSQSVYVYDYNPDTTRQYKLTSIALAFIQSYADMHTRVIYKLAAQKDAWFYVGLAFQTAIPFGGKIREDYKLQNAKWSTTNHDWLNTDKAETHQDVPAKKVTYFFWGVPLGVSVKASKRLMALAEIHYWHNWNRTDYTGHKDSHALNLYLTAGLRYNL